MNTPGLLAALGLFLYCVPVHAESLCDGLPVEMTDRLITHSDIEDPHQNLQRIFRTLKALQTGERTTPVRIALIGDSNHTLDHSTDALRRIFAKRFQSAGHGFIAAAKPWSWYDHADIRVTPLNGWRSYAISRPKKGRFKG